MQITTKEKKIMNKKMMKMTVVQIKIITQMQKKALVK